MFRRENIRVRKHLKAHKHVAQKGPFNDVPGLVCESRAMSGRQLVEFEVERLICPVCDKAEQEASDG